MISLGTNSLTDSGVKNFQVTSKAEVTYGLHITMSRARLPDIYRMYFLTP